MIERAIKAELDLAKLMGWTGLQVGGQERGFKLPATWVNGYPPGSDMKDRELVPFWAREDGAAFQLAVQARIHFAINEDGKGWAEHIDGGDYVEFQGACGDLSELRLAIIKVATARRRVVAQEAAEQKGGE
jgi:hypothetical protein